MGFNSGIGSFRGSVGTAGWACFRQGCMGEYMEAHMLGLGSTFLVVGKRYVTRVSQVWHAGT